MNLAFQFTANAINNILITIVFTSIIIIIPSQVVTVAANTNNPIDNYCNRSFVMHRVPSPASETKELWVVPPSGDLLSLPEGISSRPGRFSILSKSRFRTASGLPYSVQFTGKAFADIIPDSQTLYHGTVRIGSIKSSFEIRLDQPWLVIYRCQVRRWWSDCVDLRTGLTVVRLVRSINKQKFTYIPVRTDLNGINDCFQLYMFSWAHLYQTLHTAQG